MKGKLDSCKKTHVYFNVGFWSCLEISAKMTNVFKEELSQASSAKKKPKTKQTNEILFKSRLFFSLVLIAETLCNQGNRNYQSYLLKFF